MLTSIPKTKWYDTWMVPNMTVSFFAATDIKVHRHIRSRVSGAYSMSAILSLEPLIQKVADECWQKFGEFADQSNPVPMHEWGNYFAFDVVGQLAMGGKLGFLEQGKDVDGIIKSIHDGFYLMSNMGNVPLQMFWFNNSVAQWAVKKFGGKRLNAFSVFLDWLEERVDERLHNGLGNKRRDMLQHFVEAKDIKGEPVKKGDIMIEGVNILGAGADTTTIGILAILGYLLCNPAQLERLQKEIDQAYVALNLAHGQEISFKDAENLPFLSAVVKESTRLHPSIQYQLPRYVPKGGTRIDKYWFKEGTICGISAASMNRSKEIFGDDADEWKPDRWIARDEQEEEAVKVRKALLTTVRSSIILHPGK
jgi:cytochrome P450